MNPLDKMHNIYNEMKNKNIKNIGDIYKLLNDFNNHPEVKEFYQKYKRNYIFDKVLKFVLTMEGGKIFNKNDYGGKTNKGITQKTYDTYREKKKLLKKDVYEISDEEVKDIYHKMYWLESYCLYFNDKLASVIFDTAVNFGVSGAFTFIKEVLNLDINKTFTEDDIKSLLKCDQDKLAFKIIENRKKYRQHRVNKDKTQSIFLQGWLNRDNNLEKFIKEL